MVYNSSRYTWLTFVSFLTLASLSVPPGRSLAAEDPGLEYEQSLQTRSQSLFGFEQPVAESATTPSSTAPGDQAVEVAKNLQVRVVSSTVGEDADMITLWPDEANPTHTIICNEIDGTAPGSPASVQRVRLSDGHVEDIVFGLDSCDPVRRTAWGTIVVGEEAGPAGRLWEILDPLHVNGVTVDRSAGTSSDPDHVVTRTALGRLSFEGIVFLPNGTTYYGDELRPSNGQPGGAFTNSSRPVRRTEEPSVTLISRRS